MLFLDFVTHSFIIFLLIQSLYFDGTNKVSLFCIEKASFIKMQCLCKTIIAR